MLKKKAQIKRDSGDSFEHSKWDFVHKKKNTAMNCMGWKLKYSSLFLIIGLH